MLYSTQYSTSFVAVAPFFRAKDERVQTGTVKFFDKAFSKLTGMKVMALSAYLHRKAIAWYKRFPPIHSPDRADDPKMPQVDGGDGAGGVARGREGFRGAPRGGPSHHRTRPTTRAGNEAQSAQLFLLLSDIAWYIAGAGCYIPPFISGVLYS